MEYIISVIQKIEVLAKSQAGVFSLSDIKNIFGIISKDRLFRYLAILEKKNILIRFIRGFYICKDFDPYLLSQRIASESYISCESILAKEKIINTIPQKMITSVKLGPGRIYKHDFVTIKHLSINPDLYFGFNNEAGINIATKEKAFLDTLYYYKKGRSLYFDIYSDIDYSLLDKGIIFEYLKKYNDKRFVSFIRNLLNDNIQE